MADYHPVHLETFARATVSGIVARDETFSPNGGRLFRLYRPPLHKPGLNHAWWIWISLWKRNTPPVYGGDLALAHGELSIMDTRRGVLPVVVVTDDNGGFVSILRRNVAPQALVSSITPRMVHTQFISKKE